MFFYVLTTLPRVGRLHNALFSFMFKRTTNIEKFMDFVICRTTVTLVFCSRRRVYHFPSLALKTSHRNIKFSQNRDIIVSIKNMLKSSTALMKRKTGKWKNFLLKTYWRSNCIWKSYNWARKYQKLIAKQ